MKKDILHGLEPSVLLGMIGYYPPHGHSFTLPKDPEAPVLTMFKMLVEEIGEDGVKGTTKKNLPLKLCKKIQSVIHPEIAEKYPVRTEQDYRDLSVLRRLSERAKLIYFRKGRFVLSRDAKKLIKKEAWGTIYQKLFTVFVYEYNWAVSYGWSARWNEESYIQERFILGLHLLQKYGVQERLDQFCIEEYLELLPVITEEFFRMGKENGYKLELDSLIRLITRRFIHDFAHFFGLLTIREQENTTVKYRSTDYFVKKTPLLDEIFQVENRQSDADVYVFEIALEHDKKIKREIRIQGDRTFLALHDTIFLAYHRHDTHLFSFYRKHKKGFQAFDRRDAFEVTHKMMLDGYGESLDLMADAEQTRIDSVGMKEGDEWSYLFDFGDDWTHDLVLKKIEKPKGEETYPVVDIISGESPPQYWYEDEE